MSLKRTVYRIAGKDYEESDLVTFTFFVQRVSINNFLNLKYFKERKVRDLAIEIGEFTIDNVHTNVDAAIKPITIHAYASTLAEIFSMIGITSHHDIEKSDIYVRNRELRAVDTVRHERYNGISVFDPVTKKTRMVSGAPKKIEGRQAIINGKLWRRYSAK